NQRKSGSAKHILFACGDGSQPGDFSIERLTTGQLRGWHVGTDGILDFFESTNGVTGSEVGTGIASLVVVTMGTGGARVYQDGAELASAAIPGNTNAWNNARVKCLGRWTDGVQSPADGAFDHVQLWDRELSPAEIAG